MATIEGLSFEDILKFAQRDARRLQVMSYTVNFPAKFVELRFAALPGAFRVYFFETVEPVAEFILDDGSIKLLSVEDMEPFIYLAERFKPVW